MLWLRRFIFTFPLVVIALFAVAFALVSRSGRPSENVLIMGSIGEPENLNPIRATTTSATDVTDLVFNGLIRTDEDLNLVGGLAERWDLEQSSRLFFDNEADAEAVLAAARLAFGRASPTTAPDAAAAATTQPAAWRLADSARDGQAVTLHFVGDAGADYQDALAEALKAHRPRDVWLIAVRPTAEKFADGTEIKPPAVEQRVRAALAEAGADATIIQTYTVMGSTLELAGHGPREPVRKVIDALFKAGGDDALAEIGYEWFAAQDKPTFVFHLRKGVMWQGATLAGHKYEPAEFTSADCVFTYERLVDAKVASRRAPDYVLVESVAAPDRYTFRVTYKKPYSSALISWAMDMLPRHILADHDVQWWAANFDRAPIGTGPFRFSYWQSGEKLLMALNAAYHEGPPNLDGIYIRYIPDELNIKLALETGEIDYYSVEPHAIGRFRENPDFTLYEFLSRGYNYIGWNLSRPLFQDKRVRRALAHGVDVPSIIQHMLYGMAIQGNGVYTPQFWFANPNIQPLAYDPDRARALLTEAGWKDTDGDGWLDKDGRTFEFDLITNQGNDTRKDISVLVQADLKKIGVKVNLAQFEWTVFIQNHIDTHNFDACVLGWSVGIDYDMYQLFHSSQAADGLNFCGYRSAEADALIERIRTTFDREKLRRLTWRLQEVIFDDQPYLWLYVPKAVVAIQRGRFRVYRPTGDGGWVDEPIRNVKAGFRHYLPYWYRVDHPPEALRAGRGDAP